MAEVYALTYHFSASGAAPSAPGDGNLSLRTKRTILLEGGGLLDLIMHLRRVQHQAGLQNARPHKMVPSFPGKSGILAMSERLATMTVHRLSASLHTAPGVVTFGCLIRRKGLLHLVQRQGCYGIQNHITWGIPSQRLSGPLLCLPVTPVRPVSWVEAPPRSSTGRFRAKCHSCCPIGDGKPFCL